MHVIVKLCLYKTIPQWVFVRVCVCFLSIYSVVLHQSNITPVLRNIVTLTRFRKKLFLCKGLKTSVALREGSDSVLSHFLIHKLWWLYSLALAIIATYLQLKFPTSETSEFETNCKKLLLLNRPQGA